MTFLGLSRTGRRWLIVLAVAAVLAASFAVGLIFGPRQFVPVLAQQSAPQEVPAPEPVVEVVSSNQYGTVSVIKYPKEPDPRGLPGGPHSADGGPPPGNYVYLPRAHRYVSLPDDVKMVDRITFMTCVDYSKCPVTPYFVFQRGTAKIGVDSSGKQARRSHGTRTHAEAVDTKKPVM